MRRLTLPRKIYDYFLDHWVFSAFAMTFPAYWLAAIKLIGKDLNLVDKEGGLTLAGHWLTWPIVLGAFLFALLKTRSDFYDREGKKKGAFIWQRLLGGVNVVTSKKMTRFCEYVVAGSTNKDITAFKDITQPRLQISSLLDNIQSTLSEIFDIDSDQIGLSILYKKPQHEWMFLESINITHDLDLQQLLNNPQTTARQIIDGKASSLFFPDKRIAEQSRQYVSGPKDRSFNTIGSVFCQDISIGTEPLRFQAVLSITTYGRQLCLEEDFDARGKIENKIIPTFETRLRLELALLYIKEVLNPKCLNCPS